MGGGREQKEEMAMRKGEEEAWMKWKRRQVGREEGSKKHR
jgi:hypothetical protein